MVLCRLQLFSAGYKIDVIIFVGMEVGVWGLVCSPKTE